MILIAPQNSTEHVLERRARELGVEIVRGAAVNGLRQDDNRVTVELTDGSTCAARYVVGADGAHSTVRGLLGVDFVGKQYQTHIMLADVRLTQPPSQALFNRISDAGAVIVVPFGGGWFRAIAWDRGRERVPLDVPLPMDEMRAAFERIAGTTSACASSGGARASSASAVRPASTASAGSSSRAMPPMCTHRWAGRA